MGSIQQEMQQELKDAMRARDQPRLDALRQVQTEVSMAKAAPGFSGEVDDTLYQRVIAAYVKKMDKARQEYDGLGERAADMAKKLAFEVSYLSRWLPKKLDEAGTRALVQRTIDELGVTGIQATGRVMGQIMKQHKDDIDGTLVNRLVRELLAK